MIWPGVSNLFKDVETMALQWRTGWIEIFLDLAP